MSPNLLLRVLRDLADRAPPWSSLRAIGNNRATGSAYAWFIITPLAARFLEYVPNRIVVPFGANEIPISLGLPFSWIIFFFAALFLSIGHLAYSLFCPEIIRNYRSYPEFKEEGKGKYQLLGFLRGSMERKFGPVIRSRYGEIHHSPDLRQDWVEATSSLRQFAKDFFGVSVSSRPPGSKRPKDQTPIQEGASDHPPDEDTGAPVGNERLTHGINRLYDLELDRENEAFWWVYQLPDKAAPLSRAACSGAFGIGLVLLGIVLLQNIYFVLKHI